MTAKPPGKRTCLYTSPQLDAVITDMARQAAGLLTGRTQIAIVGILRRGAPLAERLNAHLIEHFGLARARGWICRSSATPTISRCSSPKPG